MCHKRFSCCYLTSYRGGKKVLLWCLVLVVVLLNISDSGSYETITKTKDCDHAFSKADGIG